MNQQNELSQQEYNAAFQDVATRGALVCFSEFRDQAIQDGNELQQAVQETAAKRTLTTEEQKEVVKAANQIRDSIVLRQYMVDAAYRFDQIKSSEGQSVN